MVGLVPSRGDTISTASVPFQKQAATTGAAGGPLGMIGVSSPSVLVRDALIGLAALVFLFMLRKNLKRREGDARFAEPTWLREISQATPIAALEAATLPSGAVQHHELMQKEAEQIVTRQPEHVALQVQQWMNE
jgi:flagellar biosynthesis/type III secretory pathway M-ring protein FliF/YscJ